MIILIQDRENNYHLSDYTPYTGYKYTLCNLIYHKNDIVNTLAMDNSIPDICRTCHENYEAMYLDDLEYDTRMAHGQLQDNLKYKYQYQAKPKYSLMVKYWDASQRNWGTLRKLQRKVTRK